MSALLEELLSLPSNVRDEVINGLTPDAARALKYDWRFWARPEQVAPPGAWSIWLYLAGRGSGKTRAGAEWIIEQANDNPRARIALVAPTAADCRDVQVEGESGILSVSSPDFKPVYEPSKRLLTWPNGAQAHTYSAEEPGRLRGPQHTHAWCDELASWAYPESWDMLMFGLRLPPSPRCIVTTTPKPIKSIKELVKRARNNDGVVISRGSTYENRANLAPQFFKEIVSRYEGTRLGRQEIYAEILDDIPGALWTAERFDANRVSSDRVPDLQRIVVAIDPTGTSTDDSDEVGIVVEGKGIDGEGYLLADLSGIYSPDEWGARAVFAYHKWRADCIIAEGNYGGDMVEHVIKTHDKRVKFKKVTASRGKCVRAEPVAALDEQGRVHHVGYFAELEEQCRSMTANGYLGDRSPDRLDAKVWAETELFISGYEFNRQRFHNVV